MGPRPPRKRPLPDWDPAGPRGRVRPRTLDEKVADDLRELKKARERDKATLEKWREEADRKAKEQKARERIHGPEWMERRTRCAGSLAILANEIKIRKNNWSNVAIDVSKAYEAAYTSLTKMLDAENAHDQFLFNLAFTALAAVSVGGLAVIFTKAGEKWQRFGVSQLFVDSAEDAVQAGVGGLLTNVAAPLAAAEAKYESIAIPSPFSLKGELDKLLNDMESTMLQWCIDRQKEIKELPLSDFEFYDPQKLDNEIARYLEEKDKEFNSKPFLDQASKGALATELEKLMVGLWSASFCETQINKSWYSVRRRLPKSIISRLVQFGFVLDTGHYSDADVLRIADWGPNTKNVMQRLIHNVKSYRAKKFG